MLWENCRVSAFNVSIIQSLTGLETDRLNLKNLHTHPGSFYECFRRTSLTKQIIFNFIVFESHLSLSLHNLLLNERYMNVFFPFKSTCRSSMIFFVISTKLNNDGNLFLLQQHFRNFNNFSWRMMQMWIVNWLKVSTYFLLQFGLFLMGFWFHTRRVIYGSLDAEIVAKVKFIKLTNPRCVRVVKCCSL